MNTQLPDLHERRATRKLPAEKRRKPRKTLPRSLRRGSVIVLVSVMLVVFLILAAMSIDVAFMQLVRA